MIWIKDAIQDLYLLINGLTLRARTMFVACIIFSVAGYFYMQEYHTYKIELARIQISQPSLAPKTEKTDKTVQMAGMISKDEIKTTALGGTQK